MARTLRVDMPRASSEGGRDLDRVRSALVAATLTQGTTNELLEITWVMCICSPAGLASTLAAHAWALRATAALLGFLHKQVIR